MKNQKGISLIALIITIIVIIILAAVVIGSSLRTPEQANWARFCQDYSEIQQSIQVRRTNLYGDYSVNANRPGSGTIAGAIPSDDCLYMEIATGVAGDALTAYEAVLAGTTPNVQTKITGAGFTKLGVSRPTYTVDNWWITDTGVAVYATGFNYNDDSTGNKFWYTPNIGTTEAAAATAATNGTPTDVNSTVAAWGNVYQ